jgi:hypothetical protein
MVQYNLPKSETRREPEGPQVAGLVSGAAETAPKLAKYLAEWLLKRNVDPREVYKQTGYIQDTTTGELIYSFGDQGMKVRTDNPLLAPPEAPGGAYAKEARVYEKPGIPMKEGDAGYKVQREQIVPRHENDPIGERVRNPKAVMPSGAEISRARYGYPNQTKPGEELVWSDPTGMDQPPGSLPTSAFGLPSDVKDPNQMGFWDLPSDVWGDPVGLDFLNNGMSRNSRSNVSTTPTFEELFTHPLQEQYTPELGGIPVTARYTDSAGDYSGRYWGGDNPGDVSKATASAEGQVGGVDVMNSMPSVALHEVGAHGGQNLFGWHRGGSKSESWMEDRGKELRRQAAQAQVDLMNQKSAVMSRLMQEQGINDPDRAADVFDELFPGYWDRRNQYIKAESDAAVSPDYTAYQYEGGEAAGRNFQTRAQDLTSDIPMTDTHWKGTKKHEGDVHPLETYDVAPDLMRQRVVTKSEVPLSSREVKASKQFDVKPVDQNTYMAESQPLRSQFDWLLKKAPAAAGVGTLATMGLSDPASASEGPEGTFSTPKTDRLPAASPETAKGRMELALQQAKANTAATDARMPKVEPDLSPFDHGKLWSGIGKSYASGGVKGSEETLGMGADLQDWLGLVPSARFPDMPSSEQLHSAVDWLTPEWLDKIVRYKPQGPIEEGYSWLGEQTVDPTTPLLGGLGKVGKVAGRL